LTAAGPTINDARMVQLLSADDLARMLSTTTKQVANMRQRGQLPPPLRLPGLGYRWPADAVEAWIRAARR
jgi:predicted DNA-binding transcriptional regulator AlpA